MPTTLTVAPPESSPAPRAPSRRGLGAAVAVIAFALAVTGTAYVLRIDAADSGPYVEFPYSDAQAVDAPPLAAAGPTGIALANAATQATIDRLVSVTTTSASPGQLALLARLLLQRAAVTGDADTYTRAITALDRALALAPASLDVRAQRAAARLTTHDFIGAAQDAAQVLAISPDNPGALGASYDAAFETGNYTLAETRLARLVQLGPNAPQVLFRQARWATLHGDKAGAISFASRAQASAIASGAVGTGRATYDLISGKQALDDGRYSVAIGAYESALAAAPGWHAALAGLGRARAAAGDLVGAEQALALAADTLPLPETLSALGNIRMALGDEAGAALAYGTVDVVARLESVQRLFNRAIVLSRADRGTDTAVAVRDARAEFSIRHDVYGYDALGWALLANGQVEQAVRYADESLALGTLDPRLFAHAGLAHAAAGNTARARTLLTEAIAMSPNVDPLLMNRVTAALAALPTGAGA